MSGPVTLVGHLVCRTEEEIGVVRAHLDRHVALTRAEPGCLFFEVTETAEPGVWKVRERFRDAAAFRAHQSRAADSDWGHATNGIERAYTVTGLD